MKAALSAIWRRKIRPAWSSNPVAKATLNGVPLLAFGAVGWSLTSGVNPYTRIFEVLKGDIPQILAAGAGDVELVFEPVDARGRKSARLRAPAR